jgi:hypothetical protein
MFDRCFIPQILKIQEKKTGKPQPKWEHEEASCAMFRYLIDKHDLMPEFKRYGLTEAHVKLVQVIMYVIVYLLLCHFLSCTFVLQELVFGDVSDAPSDWEWTGVPKDKTFLLEIVANKRNGIDVDKVTFELAYN